MRQPVTGKLVPQSASAEEQTFSGWRDTSRGG